MIKDKQCTLVLRTEKDGILVNMMFPYHSMIRTTSIAFNFLRAIRLRFGTMVTLLMVQEGSHTESGRFVYPDDFNTYLSVPRPKY